MSDELLALATEIMDWHDCADGDVDAGNGHFRLVCLNDSEQQRLNLRAVLREAASALRLAAQSPEPVTVKPLEWNEYTDERGGPDWWDAETLAGTYYGIALLVDGFFVEYDYTAVAKGLHDLDAAKAAAQADYEQRIRSALVNAPQSASDGALREALAFTREFIRGEQIESAVVGISSMQSLGEYIDTALAASDATKSDGGVESRYAAACAQPRGVEPEVAPGPSDLMQKFEKFKAATDERLAGHTRPADVTVKELASSVMASCSAIWAHEARQIARALLDTYKIGAK